MSGVLRFYHSLTEAGRHRLIVSAFTFVLLVMAVTIGIPGAPEGTTGGLVATVLVVAFIFWIITEPSILLVVAVVSAVLLLLLAPSFIGNTIIIAGLMVFIGGFCAFGIALGGAFNQRQKMAED